MPVMEQDMRTLLVATQPHTQEEAETYNATIRTLIQKHGVIRQDKAPAQPLDLSAGQSSQMVESEQMEGTSEDNEPRTYAELTAPTEGYTPVDMGTTNEMY